MLTLTRYSFVNQEWEGLKSFIQLYAADDKHNYFNREGVLKKILEINIDGQQPEFIKGI